jgi:hypothetical protein
MAKAQDTAVNAALYDGSTTDATTTVTYPTGAELLGIVARGSASVYANTQRFAKQHHHEYFTMVECDEPECRWTSNL